LKNTFKKIKNSFKQTGYSLFKIVYGNIQGVILPKESSRIKKSIVKKINNLEYRIFTIQDCRVYTDTINNLAIILDKKLVDGPSFQLINTKNALPQNNIVFKIGTPRIKKKLKGKVFSLLTGGAGNENYWHWLFDVLPRLGLLSDKINIKEVNFFLFPSLKKKFQLETLNVLEIPKHKRVSCEEYRHFETDEIVVVDHPYVLKNDPSTEIQNIPDWIIKWLRNILLKKVKLKKNNFPKKFYIDRSDAKSNLSLTRKISNEKKVVEVLTKNGFSSVLLGSLTFEEQVSLFNNATHIVGLHGAGFANLVFCSPKTFVLEFKPETAGFMYKNLAIKNNLIYKDISIIPHEHAGNNQQGFIEVPINMLEEKIK